MRVLIADRNARLLESVSRRFAHQFSIQTASTREHCEYLLRQGEFDLAIICEKLADGPGLHLLGQIARSSPDTLRIFAARRSRLQLLKGRLGPFGLFRTLAYPMDAQKLLSALALARAAREIDPPGAASTPGPAAVRPTAKRYSLVSADTLFSINVPMTIASMTRSRPSELSRVPLPAMAQSAARPRLPSKSEAFERALARREAAKRAASSQIVSRPSRRGRKLAEASGGRNRSLAPTPPLGSLPKLVSRVTAAHSTHRPQLADATPKRSMLLLGATMVAVFLVATLVLNRFDAAAGPSSSALATRTSSIGEQPVIAAPPQNSTPASPTTSVRPARSVAQRAEPKPDSAGPEVGAADPQMAASNTPIADPSSFGSEAYEPIYSN
jgi:ActR/RegA family two-component response regulator